MVAEYSCTSFEIPKEVVTFLANIAGEKHSLLVWTFAHEIPSLSSSRVCWHYTWLEICSYVHKGININIIQLHKIYKSVLYFPCKLQCFL